jgi:hypothetical protein
MLIFTDTQRERRERQGGEKREREKLPHLYKTSEYRPFHDLRSVPEAGNHLYKTPENMPFHDLRPVPEAENMPFHDLRSVPEVGNHLYKTP